MSVIFPYTANPLNSFNTFILHPVYLAKIRLLNLSEIGAEKQFLLIKPYK
tara:strand:- start:1630 stop:1779 length:150 start_codon:yes stop_codon:yes gene_type:complete